MKKHILDIVKVSGILPAVSILMRFLREERYEKPDVDRVPDLPCDNTGSRVKDGGCDRKIPFS